MNIDGHQALDLLNGVLARFRAPAAEPIRTAIEMLQPSDRADFAFCLAAELDKLVEDEIDHATGDYG